MISKRGKNICHIISPRIIRIGRYASICAIHAIWCLVDVVVLALAPREAVVDQIAEGSPLLDFGLLKRNGLPYLF